MTIQVNTLCCPPEMEPTLNGIEIAVTYYRCQCGCPVNDWGTRPYSLYWWKNQWVSGSHLHDIVQDLSGLPRLSDLLKETS